MMPERAQVILDFWFKETPSEMRFKKDEKFDQKIKDNFLKDYELACQNEYDDWQDNPMSCLALVILFADRLKLCPRPHLIHILANHSLAIQVEVVSANDVGL